MQNEEKQYDSVPPWKRYLLTITEAANYYHIGEHKLRSIVDENLNSDFVIMNGNRILLKRKQFEEYLDRATCI